MKVVRLRHENGATATAILGEPGRIYTPYVMIELPSIRLRRIPNGDVERYATDLTYPLKKAAREFLRFGNQHSLTRGARRHLKGAWS